MVLVDRSLLRCVFVLFPYFTRLPGSCRMHQVSDYINCSYWSRTECRESRSVDSTWTWVSGHLKMSFQLQPSNFVSLPCTLWCVSCVAFRLFYVMLLQLVLALMTTGSAVCLLVIVDLVCLLVFHSSCNFTKLWQWHKFFAVLMRFKFVHYAQLTNSSNLITFLGWPKQW